MERENNNSGLKIIIAVLAVLLIGSLIYMYKMSTDGEKTEQQFITEKEQLITDLEAARAQYDESVAENSGLKADFEEERAKVEELLAKVKKADGDVAELKRYKNDYFKLKREMESLMAENKMLKQENAVLIGERDSTMNALDETRRFNDTLINQNANLSQTVDKGSKLVILNLKAEPYKERNSGKLVATEKARRVDLLKISFTIAANEIAQAGNKTYYIQIIDSRNNVLGEKKTETFGDYSLTYSFITNAIYENKTMNIDETLSGKDFASGTYYVNVFDRDKLVANSSFSLK